MSKKITYVRSEKLSEEQRKEFNLPSKGTVVLEVSVNSLVQRRYESLPQEGFFDFLRQKVKENVN